MYNDTITLFNRYQTRSGDIWYPTVLHNVDLNTDKAAVVARYGENATDNAVLHVKYQRKDKDMIIAGKKYKAPKEWDRQVNDDLPGTVTFTAGQKFDFFIKGEWEGGTDPIDDESGEYGDTGFYDFMNSKYDHVYAITNVSGPFHLIPHFNITGR